MELINNTKFSHLLYRTSLPKDKIACSVCVRVVFDVINGTMVVADDQNFWTLSPEPRMTEYGPIESDLVFRRGGVDLMIFGYAHAENNRPVRESKVRIQLGSKLDYSLDVVGNRTWKSNAAELTMSEPEPFTKMPLSLFRAFGGVAKWDGLDIPFGQNQFGTGYYWDKEDAEDKPLPNIENPNHRIRYWNDRPAPVGFVNAPMNGSRAEHFVEFGDKSVKKIDPRFFNSCFRSLILDELNPGDEIRIEGMTQSGDFSAVTSDLSLTLHLQFGKQMHERPLAIDQIGILPGLSKVFVSYRFPFRYNIRAMEKRICTINQNLQDGRM